MLLATALITKMQMLIIYVIVIDITNVKIVVIVIHSAYCYYFFP